MLCGSTAVGQYGLCVFLLIEHPPWLRLVVRLPMYLHVLYHPRAADFQALAPEMSPRQPARLHPRVSTVPGVM